ncbi:MAG: hypothetical protein ABSE48_03465 [Verrucomicrobiota bacterium]|jgi:hypothetical protein
MTVEHEIEILLVEDDQDDLDMTLRVLRKANLAKFQLACGIKANSADFISDRRMAVFANRF